jgi:hypothetical protein
MGRVCGMNMCELLVCEDGVRMVWGGVACGKGVCVWECACARAWHRDSVVVMVEAAWCGCADDVWLCCAVLCWWLCGAAWCGCRVLYYMRA